MKKIDKLVLGSFLGPFLLTFFVVIFILLSQFMLRYLDEIVGKDLDTIVIAELIFYFSIFMTPNAFPLAVLLSSLMTFGNLGQHFELTALKGSGISLIRVLAPIFFFSLLLTVVAYFSNNFVVPKANLKAFSLLWDVKQMKPSMDLKEGAFYNGIDGYSIKVGKKYQDDKTLEDIIIYDHTGNKGNKSITLADSGQMYNIYNDRYLVLEMFDGKNYSELGSTRGSYIDRQSPNPLVRREFKSQKVVFDLASFDLKRTKEELFASNRLMKNSSDLRHDADSMQSKYTDLSEEVKEHIFKFFDYHLQDIIGIYKERAREREKRKRQEEMELDMEETEEDDMENEDTISKIIRSKAIESELRVKKNPASESQSKIRALNADSLKANIRKVPVGSGLNKSTTTEKTPGAKIPPRDGKQQKADSVSSKDTLAQSRTFAENMVLIDSILQTKDSKSKAIKRALTHARYVKNNMVMRKGQLAKLKTEINKFQLERYKKLSYAVTILIFFFIGAPLGSIIKKGGLGIPVLISISFFILFYIVSMICEKYARTNIMDPLLAAWFANLLLLPVGIFFMKQAKNDARLFDTDFYSIMFTKLKAIVGQSWRRRRKTKV
jgi:lipopolysaccharide export system permease protein